MLPNLAPSNVNPDQGCGSITTDREIEPHFLDKVAFFLSRAPRRVRRPSTTRRDSYTTRVDTLHHRKDVDRFVLGFPAHIGVRVGW